MGKTIRVVFRAECYVDGDTYQEAYEKYLEKNLFDKDSNAGFVELVCVEDADTFKEITDEIKK